MRQPRANRGCRGFSLAEFVVAIVFLGTVLGPLLIFVTRLQDLNSAIGQQVRREAARSWADQAIAAGMDPSRAPILGAEVNPAVPPVEAPRVSEEAGSAPAGRPHIVPLRIVLEETVPEPRTAGAGYQIGAGGTVDPRGVPNPPLQPIVMSPPVITPTDREPVSLSMLKPADPGDPFTLTVEARAAVAATVRATCSRLSASGSGAVEFLVNAVDLMKGVSGSAWSEFSGDAAVGDRAVQLPDGRMRWLVMTSEKRLQIYEPSRRVSFSYRFDPGAPILVHGMVEVPSGATVSFDYAAYAAVQDGTVAARIDFPAATKQAFGTRWVTLPIGFQCTFGEAAGPIDGGLSRFFAPEALLWWADRVAVVASPLLPAGAISRPGSWTVQRTRTVLGVPVLASTSDKAGFHAAGSLEFSAPKRGDAPAIGRLSFQNGTMLSTGSSLSVSVVP